MILFWYGFKEAIANLFNFLTKSNGLVSLESIFFIMNGILIFFAWDYVSHAKDSKIKKLFKVLSVFIPWNIYYFTIAYFILN